jgi:hypothetical protein
MEDSRMGALPVVSHCHVYVMSIQKLDGHYVDIGTTAVSVKFFLDDDKHDGEITFTCIRFNPSRPGISLSCFL